tara:strand:+ start:482 stop:736 length:255 start_codon:yes stop_codon:yes gene_type:complete
MQEEVATAEVSIRKRKARTIPYGYKLNEDDSDYIVSVPEELNAIEKAKEYIENCSYKEVSEWLHKTTGRPISTMGLRKVLNRAW